MKTIGIIGAMEEEISLIKTRMEIISVKNIVGLDFYTGKVDRKNIVLVRSGIGKVNAAICTQALIDFYGVDCIMNTGVAGAISKELDVYDIVIGQDFVHHDFDTSPTGDPIGVIPRMDSSFRSDEELIRIAREAITRIQPDRPPFIGRIATGDQFVADKERKQFIWNTFKAYCVEMEGAAIAQTCSVNKIPFVAVRAISDRAEEAAAVSYQTFVQEAVKISSRFVEEMIKTL